MYSEIKTITKHDKTCTYLNGKLHSFNDNPSCIKWNTITYHKNGKIHRDVGPAYIDNRFGDKYWYKNGKIHRENGPAVEWCDGTKKWYLNGKYYTEKEFKSVLLYKKLKNI
jgi:hypothetical protein